MDSETVNHRYPFGTGWLFGSLLSLGLGVVVWFVTREIVLVTVAVAATVAPLSITLEQSLDTAQPSPGQRRLLKVALVVGTLLGALVLAYALFLA